MTSEFGYRQAFYLALFLHLSLAALLVVESFHSSPALTVEAKNKMDTELAHQTPQVDLVQAVSVNSEELQEVIDRLKEEKAEQAQIEVNRQKNLVRQAEQARQSRLREEQRLNRIKEEADRIAIARKKQAEEEERRLKQLSAKKEKEEKRLAELKSQKEKLKKEREEALKLAQLEQKQAEERSRERQLKAEVKKKQEEARAQAARQAEQQAQMAGEVNRYKALIVNAISRQWILPENANSNLSSQFRIRLAPDGMVLQVNLTRSSGDSVLDRSAQTAIFKASPLPVPKDKETFNLFRDISLTVRPEQVRG